MSTCDYHKALPGPTSLLSQQKSPSTLKAATVCIHRFHTKRDQGKSDTGSNSYFQETYEHMLPAHILCLCQRVRLPAKTLQYQGTHIHTPPVMRCQVLQNSLACSFTQADLKLLILLTWRAGALGLWMRHTLVRIHCDLHTCVIKCDIWRHLF